MITFVESITVDNLDNTTRIVEVKERSNVKILVKSITRDGIVRVKAETGTHIILFCDVIVGCLCSESNFFKKVAESFKYDINKICTSEIECEFNNIIFTVKAGESVLEVHRGKYLAKLSCQTTKHNDNNLKYRNKRAKNLKKKIRNKKVREEILSIANSTEIEFKDDESRVRWEEFVKHGSMYETEFAIRWVKYMQHIMKKHNKTVNEIVDTTYAVCPFKYISKIRRIRLRAATVSMIVECWKYGDGLKMWSTRRGFKNYEFDYKKITSTTDKLKLQMETNE